MNNINNNEVPTDQSFTPHNSTEEPEVSSASSTNHYTTDEPKNQVTNENSIQQATGFVNTFNNSIPSFYDNKKKLQHSKLAKFIIERYHVITLQGNLYIFMNGIYVNDIEAIKGLILHLASKAKPADINLVLVSLHLLAPTKFESHYRYIAFKNCIVNAETLEVIEFDADKFVITTRVYADYSPSSLEDNQSTVAFVQSYFKPLSCGDHELMIFYLEMLGYSMMRSSKFQLGFLLKRKLQ